MKHNMRCSNCEHGLAAHGPEGIVCCGWLSLWRPETMIISRPVNQTVFVPAGFCCTEFSAREVVVDEQRKEASNVI